MTAPPLQVTLPEALVEQIAERAAEIVAERLSARNGDQPAEWLRGAEQIATYIAAPPSRVYHLNAENRIPVQHDGAWLVARRADLDRWLEGGAR